MSRQNRASNLSFLFLGAVILLCASWIWHMNTQTDPLTFSQVEQLFRQEKVESFVVEDNLLVLRLRENPVRVRSSEVKALRENFDE